MKKIVTSMLAFITVMSFASCGDTKTSDSSKAETKSSAAETESAEQTESVEEAVTDDDSPYTVLADFSKGESASFICSDGWSNGSPFDCTFEIGSKAAKVTRNNESKEYPAVITKSSTSGVPATNIARAWKVDGCYLKVSGKVNVERGFNGCDFKEIAQFLKENNVKIDPSELDGYKIEEFYFTGSNTMVISFTNTYTFYGDYKLNGENISYLFTVIHNKEILNASASGTLTFPADKKAELMLNTIIDGYSGQITFNLSEAN